MRRRPDIRRLEMVDAAARPGAAAPKPAHHLAEDVLESAEPACARAATARATKSFRAPGEALEMTVAAAKSRMAGAKTMETRLAFRVYLARVEGLALLFIAQQFVGGVEFGELNGSPGILLIGVGMQLLCLPPERLLDLVRASRFLHPQDLIGVAHPQELRGRR